MSPTGEGFRIVQIHPTRRCNLRCLHCYSMSAPEERDSLDYRILEDALSDTAAEGYEIASFSGGEPILYRNLGRLLSHAQRIGMRTTVTSNGMLLDQSRIEILAGRTDVLAISLDGVPESHNRMRGSEKAFDRMFANLENVRKSGISFGFIFTLTQYNVNEVDWAARFAVEQGARLFQIHPLEEVGRAGLELQGARPDELESAFAYLEAERIKASYGDQIFVQVDLFHREALKKNPERFYAEVNSELPRKLADCVSPLVIEADGIVSPLAYGFSRDFALGSITKSRIKDLVPSWITTKYKGFLDLCRDVYSEACAPSELPFLNWYELVSARSSVRPSNGAAASHP